MIMERVADEDFPSIIVLSKYSVNHVIANKVK